MRSNIPPMLPRSTSAYLMKVIKRKSALRIMESASTRSIMKRFLIFSIGSQTQKRTHFRASASAFIYLMKSLRDMAARSVFKAQKIRVPNLALRCLICKLVTNGLFHNFWLIIFICLSKAMFFQIDFLVEFGYSISCKYIYYLGRDERLCLTLEIKSTYD